MFLIISIILTSARKKRDTTVYTVHRNTRTDIRVICSTFVYEVGILLRVYTFLYEYDARRALCLVSTCLRGEI